MEDKLYWETFTKTGNVMDYLNYTACTREGAELLSTEERDAGYSETDRNRTYGDANWRI